jgi:hypothetical protein
MGFKNPEESVTRSPVFTPRPTRAFAQRFDSAFSSLKDSSRPGVIRAILSPNLLAASAGICPIESSIRLLPDELGAKLSHVGSSPQSVDAKDRSLPYLFDNLCSCRDDRSRNQQGIATTGADPCRGTEATHRRRLQPLHAEGDRGSKWNNDWQSSVLLSHARTTAGSCYPKRNAQSRWCRAALISTIIEGSLLIIGEGRLPHKESSGLAKETRRAALMLALSD